VLKSCDLMTSMTRELLLFARGETEILIRKMPLPQFVAEVDELLKQVTARTRIVVTTSIGYRGAVRIDEVKMKRALTNLAKNAREAMGDDGELFFGVEQKGDQIELVLRDSGPGLPPEIEARLFESFATHGKQGGTGLGLAIVKKIVDEHGGDIRVESTRGAGVTFRLRLPL
jgi:signal transduction histidine kinase